jgi:DNA-binding response OmpR family regulator
MLAFNNQVITHSNILIIDDRLDCLEEFALVLSEWGYSVQTASNIPSLLMLVGAVAPKLILLRVDLLERDSVEVYCHLKAQWQTSKIPIVFFNSLDNLCERLKSLNIVRTNSTIETSHLLRQVASA